MKRILLLIFIISILLLPACSFAAFELEQTYPGFSQGPDQEITITGQTPITGIIKYYSTWAIAVAILASIASLIIGGIGYLTSAGRPQEMTKARKRIARSFLGLAILTSSYLILRIVNPQIHLLKMKKISVTSGIVVLTRCAIEGYKDKATSGGICDESMKDRGLKPPSKNPASLDKLVELNQARYLSSSRIEDMTALSRFGRMVVVERDVNGPTKLNYENFQIYAIGFWGETAQDIKVKTFPAKKFDTSQGSIHEYAAKGKIDEKGDVIDNRHSFIAQRLDENEPEMQVVIIDEGIDKDFVTSKVDFTDPISEIDYEAKDAIALPHPPLSMIKEGIGPGVYLYSENSQEYFRSWNGDFSFIDFDDKVVKIEIKNIRPGSDGSGEKHNFLAILYDDAQYRGSFRAFFKKDKAPSISEIYIKENDFFEYKRIASDGTNTVDLDKWKNKKGNDAVWSTSLLGGNDYTRGAYLSTRDVIYEAGNVPKFDPVNPLNSRINVNEMDQYGKVSGVSSIQIFEIGRLSACREVRLCNRKFLQGHCISYTSMGRLSKKLYDTFALPMPWYVPINLPGVIKGTVQTSGGEEEEEEEVAEEDQRGKREKLLNPGSGGISHNIKPEEVMFERNIRSIKIDGRCLVMLFKNPVKDLRDCLSLPNNSPKDINKCWLKGTPDVNSEIFTQSDDDLTDNRIGRCSTKDVDRFGIGNISPCAAAIAVFPLDE